MEIIPLNFRQNPASAAAALIRERSLDPLRTLVIAPTQRFRAYFASFLLKQHCAQDLLAPDVLTMEYFISSILNSLGLVSASNPQRLSMLYEACAKTPGLDELLPERFLDSFASFQAVSRQIFKIFDELNGLELEPGALEHGSFKSATYSAFARHLDIFASLYQSYRRMQDESGFYDRSFLFSKVELEGILRSAADQRVSEAGSILLASPVTLTKFEQRIFSALEGKLIVLLQDTSDYDFSHILSLRNENAPLKDARSARFHYEEVPSRIYQVMAVLSIIEEEIRRGRELHEMAVLNIDPLFCEMLKDSMDDLGIENNLSGGIPIGKSRLFGFLLLAGKLFSSSLDSRLFLELFRNELFIKLSGIKDQALEYGRIRSGIFRGRIFKIDSISSGLSIGSESILALSLLERLYCSADFRALYENLCGVCSALKDAGGYEHNAAKELILNTALELTDLSIPVREHLTPQGNSASERSAVRERPFEIFLEYLKNERFPIIGSPAAGVQIIGLLETRGITFKTVVIPSFNEGFMPAEQDAELLLSSDLRHELRLPTLIDREDLELYYLKRLVDASEDSHFISIDDSSGEFDVRSRYYYLFDLNRDEKRDFYIVPFAAGEMKKSFEGISFPRLTRPKKEFSRFDVDAIKKCETRYFIARELGIEAAERLSTGIETDLVGLKVHSILQDLYAGIDSITGIYSEAGIYSSGGPFENARFMQRLGELLDRAFPRGAFYSKEEALVKRLLRENLEQAVARDCERFRKGYRVCTEFMEKTFSAPIGKEPDIFILNGRIDRIDMTPDGGYVIIDYKTGSLPGGMEHRAEKGFREVQLGIYGLLFQKSFSGATLESLCYFDLTRKRDLEPVVKKPELEEYLVELEEHLAGFLAAFREKEQLSLAEDLRHCRFCPYHVICRIDEI